jgi:hypothetical protein
MTMTIRKEDISKAKWQSKRDVRLKGCDVGKSLDAWKPYGTGTASDALREGDADKARATGSTLNKALGVARAKCAKMESNDKKDSFELIDGYETYVEKWMKELTAAENAVKAEGKKIDALKIDDVLGDDTLLKGFKAHVKKEHSENELEFVLKASKQKNLDVYNKYIKEKSSDEVNLPNDIRKQFDAENISKGPWDKAIANIKGMLGSDTLIRYKKVLRDELAKNGV